MGGNVETLRPIPVPNLLEEIGEQELTLMGSTRTIGQWAESCPIDLNDPSISNQAKNDYLVTFANKEGFVVPAEHQELFAETTSRLGLEPAYTIAPPEHISHEPNKPKPPQHKVEPKVIPVAQKYTPESPLIQATVAEQVRQQHEADEYIPEPKPLEIVTSELETTLVEISPAKPIRQPEPTEIFSKTPLPEAEKLPSKTGEHDATAKEMPLQILEDLAVVAVPQNEGAANIYDEPNAEQLTHEEIFLPAPGNPEIAQLAQPEQAIEMWVAELRKDSVELYADFTGAMYEFAQPSTPQDESEHVTERAQQQQVAGQVAEKLIALDANEAQQTAEIIQNIAGAVHGLAFLEAQGAESELLAETQAKIYELCQNLSDVLGLDFSEQQVRYLVEAVTQLEFGDAELTSLDLEKVGTHEAKYAARMLADDAAKNGYVHQALGTFTLLCAGLARGILVA